MAPTFKYESRGGGGPMCAAASARRVCIAFASASEKTATVSMPSSRQARMMRTAISPRLAMSTLVTFDIGPQTTNGRRRSQWNIPVFLLGVDVALVGQQLEAVDQARARLARFDHVVDVAARGGDVWVGEL